MITITPIPALTDNYIWLITHQEKKMAAVVDPGEAAPVLEILKQKQLTLCGILLTHHHHDHTGGVIELLTQYRVPVYGPLHDTILSANHRVTEGDYIDLPQLDYRFKVIEIPGHTKGHIALYHDKTLFCGDTLFTAGCGRIFEGTAEQMFNSLQKLTALPDDTFIYCGHEYTAANLRFAKTVEPDNRDIQQRIIDTAILRDKNKPTVPATLALEKRTNPFLRSHITHVKNAVEQHFGQTFNNDIDVFKYTRLWKDSFQ